MKRIARRSYCARAAQAALLALCIPLSAVQHAAAGTPDKPPPATTAASPSQTDQWSTAPSAEVAFPTPQRFAVIRESARSPRRLYGAGDILADAKPGQGCVLQSIEADGVRVRLPQANQTLWVAVGSTIPQSGGRRVERTVLLEAVEYRYTDGTDAENRLVQLNSRRAVVELDTTAPATTQPPVTRVSTPREQPVNLAQRLDKTIFENVQVNATGANTYEISAADARMAFDHTGAVLMEAIGAVRPNLSWNDGLTYQVKSDVVSGVLGAGGFRVDSPNLAQRAGLQTGDVIQAVNGKPINGVGDLYQAYQKMKQDPTVSSVQLNIDRQGQFLVKTYRVR